MTLALALATNLGAVGLFVAAGWGIASGVPVLRSLPWFRRLGYQYLLGVAAVAGSAWVASHVFHLSLRATVLWPLALLPAVIGLAASWARRGEEREGAPPAAPSDRRLAVAALVVAGIATAGLLADAVSEPVHDFDGTMTWTAAARWIRAGRTVDAAVLRDGRLYVTHPEYPVLLPLAQVVVHELFDTGGDERAVRGLYAAFFPALLLVALDGAWRLAGRRAALLTVLTLALVPAFTGEIDGGGSASTYSDVPLACFWGAGLVLLLRPGTGVAGGAAAGLLLGAAVLTKNEGLPLAALALGLACLDALAALWRRRRRPGPGSWRPFAPAVVALAVVALATALLRSWQAGIPRRFTDAYPILGPIALARAVADRLPLLPGPILRETLDWDTWRGFWLIIPVVLLSGAGAIRRRPIRPFVLAAVSALGMIVVAYSTTTWPGAVQVHPTWNRFLQQLTVPGALVLAAAIRTASRKGSAVPGPGPTFSAWRHAALLLFVPTLLVYASRPWPRSSVESDGASLELYTLQALHGETLVGPYSRFDWNHPGPLLFYTYAPLYALSGQRSASLPVTALLINLAAVAATLAIAARRGGARVALPMALFLAGLVTVVGPSQIADPWNPYVTILPFGLFLALASCEASGAVLPALAALGSFLVQSHVGFAPIVAAVGLVTGVRVVRAARAGVPVRRAVSIAIGVAALLWAAPIVEELRGHPGNLSSLLAFFAEQKGHHTLGEVIVPLARQLARALLGVATAFAPATSDDRATGSGLLSLLLVALLPLVASAAHRSGRRFERNLALATLLAILVGYLSLTGVVDDIHDYLIAWMSAVGALGWGLVVASLPGLDGTVGRWSVAAALVVASLLSVRLEVVRLERSPPQAVRTIVRVDELSTASERFLATSKLKRPLLVFGSHDTWPTALGVVLELRKRGVVVAIPDDWIVMFGKPLGAAGTEDGALVLVESGLDRVASARPDAVRLAARDGMVLYGLAGAPPEWTRRTGELESGMPRKSGARR